MTVENIVEAVTTAVSLPWEARYDLDENFSPSSVVVNASARRSPISSEAAPPDATAAPVRIALICSDYPPLRTSAAVQIRDLAAEFLAQGHDPVVLVPAEDQAEPWREEDFGGVTVLRLAAPAVRAPGYVRRTLAEMYLPFAMIRALRRGPWRDARWDGDRLVLTDHVLRAADLVAQAPRALPGLPDPARHLPGVGAGPRPAAQGPGYWFFKGVAASSTRWPTSSACRPRRTCRHGPLGGARRVAGSRSLQNWLSPPADVGSSIRVERTALAGRTMFVYIGNMGVAQGMDIFIDLAERLHARPDSDSCSSAAAPTCRGCANSRRSRGLDNVLFHDEVDTREMPGLLAQCHGGPAGARPEAPHAQHPRQVTDLPAGRVAGARAGQSRHGRRKPDRGARVSVSAYVGDSVEEFAPRPLD